MFAVFFLRQQALGHRQFLRKHGLQRLFIGDLSLNVSNDPAQISAQCSHLSMQALQLLGVGITAGFP